MAFSFCVLLIFISSDRKSMIPWCRLLMGVGRPTRSYVRFGRMLTRPNKQKSGSSIEVRELQSVAIVLTNPKVSTTPSSNGFTFTRSASAGRVQIEVG
jgi:hypothetical protein